MLWKARKKIAYHRFQVCRADLQRDMRLEYPEAPQLKEIPSIQDSKKN